MCEREVSHSCWKSASFCHDYICMALLNWSYPSQLPPTTPHDATTLQVESHPTHWSKDCMRARGEAPSRCAPGYVRSTCTHGWVYMMYISRKPLPITVTEHGCPEYWAFLHKHLNGSPANAYVQRSMYRKYVAHLIMPRKQNSAVTCRLECIASCAVRVVTRARELTSPQQNRSPSVLHCASIPA